MWEGRQQGSVTGWEVGEAGQREEQEVGTQSGGADKGIGAGDMHRHGGAGGGGVYGRHRGRTGRGMWYRGARRRNLVQCRPSLFSLPRQWGRRVGTNLR